MVFVTTRSGPRQLWTASRSSVNDPWQIDGPIAALSAYRDPWSAALARDTLTLYVAAIPPLGDGYDVYQVTRPSRDAEYANPVRIDPLSTDEDDFGLSLSANDREMYLVSRIGNDPHGSILYARLEGGGGCAPDCDAIRRLKVSCRDGRLVAQVKSSLPQGTELTIDNDGLQEIMTLNRKGSGKVVWENQEGVHTVLIVGCEDFVKAVNCG